ncbi:unnamed protein product [Soboliphyme baturini]|uniref:DEP domain-containing protein n=1 Tax=Soboliphyme baturini TaxID=241478 RepID=A0A183IQG8_9BILA|nr:unnamed protein product [Soboliphyme baturini]
MRTCKLWYHKREDRLSNVDFLFCPKEFPDVAVGDVLELFHVDNGVCGDRGHRLLVQITRIVEEFAPKQSNTVSVDQSLATAFQLKNYGDVVVRKVVDREAVTLSILELSIKEQCVGRADQYRFRRFLLHSCVHMHRKIEFCGIRAQVQEMCRGGERVSCGYVNDETRIVFRSSSAAAHILIQMSAEMWEFDGDGGNLYMEKCLDGFLPELFRKWQDKNCSHYVTVAVFSRWFYPRSTVSTTDKQSTLDQIPATVRDHLMIDHRGTPYQDFYHVMIQNEHYDEWMPLLSKIKCVFYKYKAMMNAYQRSLGLPKAENSTASNGNFLEALSNILHCGFEQTDQLLIVVSPGSGVFNVEHTLVNLTQQRTMDLSAGIDLVCLGEQPLHIVPLFICNSDTADSHRLFSSSSRKSLSLSHNVDDRYCNPYWINISYYSQLRHFGTFRNFAPRIKIPESLQNAKVIITRLLSHFSIWLYSSYYRLSTDSSKTALLDLMAHCATSSGYGSVLFGHLQCQMHLTSFCKLYPFCARHERCFRS